MFTRYLLFAIACATLLAVGLLNTAGCGFRSAEMPAQRPVERRTDAAGRLVYRKFDQVVEHNGKRHVVTITQEFDSLGRVLVEYGTDRPRLGKAYFYDFIYSPDVTVVNYFRWEEEGEMRLDSLPVSAFQEQKIWMRADTAALLTTITKLSDHDGWFFGRYSRRLAKPRVDRSRLRIDLYEGYLFRLPMQRVVFGKDGRLSMDGAVVVEE